MMIFKAKSTLKIIPILTTLFLIGCSAMGARFESIQKASEGNAVVYFFRDSEFASSAYCPNVEVNGEYFGCLKMNGYLRIEIPANKVNKICFCRTSLEMGKSLIVKLELKEQEMKFFEWTPVTPKISSSGQNLVFSIDEVEILIEHSEEAAMLLLSQYNES